MPDEKLITMEPVTIAAHSGGSACANVTYQGSALIDAHGKVQLSENGIKIFREVIENPEICSKYPKLVKKCIEFFTSRELNAAINIHIILEEISDIDIYACLLSLREIIESIIF